MPALLHLSSPPGKPRLRAAADDAQRRAARAHLRARGRVLAAHHVQEKIGVSSNFLRWWFNGDLAKCKKLELTPIHSRLVFGKAFAYYLSGIIRTVLTLTLLILFALESHARTAVLEDSISPNHRYRVQAAGSGKRPRITYQIVRIRDGAAIHSIETSYQPDEGELPDWSWNHSTEAVISWSPDSRYVAIDEEVHHYIGEFFLVEISRGHARNIAIPQKEMLARTRLHWDRQRIRGQFDKTAWASPHLLRLVLAGEVITSTFDDDRHTYEQARFNYTLRVDHGKATMVSMEKDP